MTSTTISESPDIEAIKAAEREKCAQSLELSTQALLLLAGEMSAQELRTVKAVLTNRAAMFRQNSI